MRYKLNNREVEILELNFEEYDMPAQVIRAVYIDNGQELTESEMETLESLYSSELYEEALQHAIGEAEMMADLAEDR